MLCFKSSFKINTSKLDISMNLRTYSIISIKIVESNLTNIRWPRKTKSIKYIGLIEFDFQILNKNFRFNEHYKSRAEKLIEQCLSTLHHAN